MLKRLWGKWDQADLVQPFHIQRTLLTWPGVRRVGLPRQSPGADAGPAARRRHLESAALIIGGACLIGGQSYRGCGLARAEAGFR